MTIAKTCDNCAFQRRTMMGWEFSQCSRVGFYCRTEQKYGGRCYGPSENGIPEMRLWEQRKSVGARIIAAIFPERAA